MRQILLLGLMETKLLFRSTKIICLFLFIVFLNIQVVTPMINLANCLNGKMAWAEPFIAAGNSAVSLLILPLIYITLLSDYPREDNSVFYFRYRVSKRVWIYSQILCGIVSSLMVLFFTLVSTCVLSWEHIAVSTEYSECVTKFLTLFPEKSGTYGALLISEKIYNHASIGKAFLYTFTLNILYLNFLSLVLLLFNIYNKKVYGLIIDVFLIIAGAAFYAFEEGVKWLFPMTHSLFGTHFKEYSSVPCFPLWGSYLLFFISEIILIILCLHAQKEGQKKKCLK